MNDNNTNILICIVGHGYQLDFIDHKKYGNVFSQLEEHGVIIGSNCRDYGGNVDISEANEVLVKVVHKLDKLMPKLKELLNENE